MKEKVLVPLKNEIMKIPATQHESDLNQQKPSMPDFRLVFRQKIPLENHN